MPDYAVRITYPYERIASLVSAWAMRCETMAVYEHPQDERVNRTHCHMILTGTNVDKKQLRNIASRFADVKGNENCSFKAFTGEERAYVYMTKGVHDPKYLLCIPRITADDWKAKWTQQPAAAATPVDKWSKYYKQFVDSQGSEIRDETTNPLYVCKKNAMFYVRDILGMVFTPNAVNIYKMLVRTYCYDYKIQIPSGDKLDW